MDAKKIGAFIYELRKKNNLTQGALAEKIPISREAVSKWERGITIPNSDTLLILSKIFNVSVDSLLLGEYISEFDKEPLQNFTLEVLEDNHQKKRKLRLLIISFSSLMLIFILLFLGYYFLNTYNSIKVYTISGESNSFFMSDGILVTTREKMYFRLGNLEIPNDIQIQKMEMYYRKKNQEKLVFSSTHYVELIKDDYGYNAYFDFNDLNDILTSTYLKIYFHDTYEVVPLTFVQDFINSNFLFVGKKKISKDGQVEEKKIESNLMNPLSDKFTCIDNLCSFYVTSDDSKISFIYDLDIKHLFVEEKNETVKEEWNYYMDNQLLYEKYLNDELVEQKEINIATKKENDMAFLKKFQEEYLIKYLS